ncbi:MAG: GNAT family N-acetyltransferase [Rhizobiales bacterium]|nr:GNAT family N-acetyltransferase [Hyphomicrobiales bacterium]
MSGGVAFRPAARAELAGIVALLADDDLGRAREDADDPAYASAFAEIEADANNEILVGVAPSGEIIACLQLTLLPGLTRRGARRALIEAVRVARHARGQGVGASLMRFAMARAAARGASLAQLTSDATRGRAHVFYARLGFAPSHLGFKRGLTAEDAR